LIEIIALVFVISVLVIASWIDFKTFILPDGLTISLVIFGLLANGFLGLQWASIESSVLGGLGGFLSLYLLNRLYLTIKGQHGIGLGDAKLLAGLGACLGWVNLPYILIIASISGLVGGFLWLKFHQKDTSHAFPFGPFIAFGGIIVLLWQI
jgi:leader peptidase (prepilin peptidase) / N-methyltransferase